jgi:hypothetical protein
MMRVRALLLCALIVVSAGALSRSGHAGAYIARPPLEAPSVKSTPTPRPPGPTRAIAGRSDGGSLPALKDEALSSQLVLLADMGAWIGAAGGNVTVAAIEKAAPEELRGAIGAGGLRISDDGRVQVYVETSGDIDELSQRLASAGARVERSDANAGIVQAQVPIAALRAVARLPAVDHVRLPDYPVINAGNVMTEGDLVVNADVLRSSIAGLDGSGVTIGVISDGVAGLAQAQASSDLPAVDTSTCNVAGSDPAGPPEAPRSEGTAMLEIIHDIAPGASLMFGNFGFLPGLAFNDTVDCLAAHADIVVDDIGFFGAGPYDGTSVISQNTADALNGSGRIRAYVTAAGNQATRHYKASFIDSGFPILDRGFLSFAHQFDDTNAQYPVEHFGLVPAPANFDRFQLNPGGHASVTLTWNDPWDTSSNDYDLFFSDGTQIRPCGRPNDQNGNDHPAESCQLTNPSDTDVQTYDIFIVNFRGFAAPRVMDLFVACSNCVSQGNGNTLDFNTPGGSVGNQSDAGGSPASVITTGAVRPDSPSGIQVYSGRGPTEDGRLKPDIVAPDRVCVTGAGGFPGPPCDPSGVRFRGTSAAAPHVAAVAALLLQCQPALTRTELRDAITDTAVDEGDPGPDNIFGNGLIDALAGAVHAGYCGQPTPTPSPTPTVTLTPTPSNTPTITPTPSITPTAMNTPGESTTTATPSRTPTITPTPQPLIGDVNCGGSVNAIDAALILQYSAGLLPGLACPANGDANLDSRVDSIDAALVLQLIAGLISDLPP